MPLTKKLNMEPLPPTRDTRHLTLNRTTTQWLRAEANIRFGRTTGLGRVIDELVEEEIARRRAPKPKS